MYDYPIPNDSARDLLYSGCVRSDSPDPCRVLHSSVVLVWGRVPVTEVGIQRSGSNDGVWQIGYVSHDRGVLYNIPARVVLHSSLAMVMSTTYARNLFLILLSLAWQTEALGRSRSGRSRLVGGAIAGVQYPRVRA